MLEALAFYMLAALTIGAALCVVTLRNVLHSALSLGLCLFGVAGLFATLGADFVFVSQLLVYVGGIAVLVLFVVLLAARQSELVLRQTNQQWIAGLFLAGSCFWGMSRYIKEFRAYDTLSSATPTTRDIARLLLSDWAVPFELVSLILLAALAGAILYSHNDHDAPSEPGYRGGAPAKALPAGGREPAAVGGGH